MRKDYLIKTARTAGAIAGMALATYTFGWKTMHPNNREAIMEYLGIDRENEYVQNTESREEGAEFSRVQREERSRN